MKKILLLLLLLCPLALQAAPAITVSGNSVTILGSSQTISLTCTLIDPNQTGMLKSGSNIITVFVTSTVTPGNVATCGPIYGNDVILDGFGNINTTFYKVQVFTVSNGIVASTPSLQQFYQFFGSGTVDLSTATPLAPSFMSGPNGSVVMPGSLIVSGPGTFKFIDGIPHIDPGNPQGWTGSTADAWITAAISALPSTGGIIEMGCGDFTLNAIVNINTKPVIMRGCGAGNEQKLTGQTRLICNLSAATACIYISTSAATGSRLEDVHVCGTDCGGTATATHLVDIDAAGDNTGSTMRITIQDAVLQGQSATTCMRIGNDTVGQLPINVDLERVDMVDCPTPWLVLKASHVTGREVRTQNQALGTPGTIIGDATHTATSWRCEECDLEFGGSTNGTSLQIISARDATCTDCFFENDGTGFAIDIPSTANAADNVNIINGHFIGNSTAASAIRVAFSGATVNIENPTAYLYAAASSFVTNTNNKRITVRHLTAGDGTVTSVFSSTSNGCPTQEESVLNGTLQGSLYCGLITAKGGISINAGNLAVTAGNSAQFSEFASLPGTGAGLDVCGGLSGTHTFNCSFNGQASPGFPMPQTIANGTASMTTALIATLACGTTVTVAATGVLTTDVIDWDENAAVTAANNGLLILKAWPTAGNVNFNYCNPTAAGVTPTAVTLNWSVRRP